MGFLSNIFSKQTCELCGKEVGMLSRAKLKDGKYICSDCAKDCSKFFSPTVYDLEEVKKHIDYMKKQEELYNKEFEPLQDKINTIKYIGGSGLIFADSIGMFEVKCPKNKEQKVKELFRYDEMMDFKMYVKENPEGAGYKYQETGVQIKMMLDAPSTDYHTKHYITKYVKEFTIPVGKNTNDIEGGMVYDHLMKIFGLNSGTYNMSKIKSTYRNLDEINRYFDRDKYSKLADDAERKVLGKTIEEIYSK